MANCNFCVLQDKCPGFSLCPHHLNDCKTFPAEVIEYPPIDEIVNGIDNVLFENVGSSLINAFLPKVKVLKAVVLNRYRELETDIEKGIQNIYSKYHSKLMDVGDDIIILAETNNSVNGNNRWWFFHLDRDVSDCSIGWAKKGNISREVMEEFFNNYTDFDWKFGEEIDVKKLKGYLQF